MFVITLIWGAIYLVLYPGLGLNQMLLGWTQIGEYEAEMAAAEKRYGPTFQAFLNTDLESLSEDEKAMATGRRLFLNYCSTCHGSDGRGSRGFPNLADADWLYGGSPEAIKTSILKGRTGVMPPWKAVLGGEEGVADMVQFVRSLGDLSHDRQGASRAAPKFQQFCSACHGGGGQGNPALGAPNLTDDVWLVSASETAMTKVIGEGRMGRMPAHEDFLGEAKSHVLAAYIIRLSRNGQR